MTDTAQHTPGPWRVFEGFTDPEITTDRPTAHETKVSCSSRGSGTPARTHASAIVSSPPAAWRYGCVASASSVAASTASQTNSRLWCDSTRSASAIALYAAS